VESAGKEVGVAPYRMPAVGHDAAMFQRRGIPASVLLIRFSRYCRKISFPGFLD
jgi:hypothetical protein